MRKPFGIALLLVAAAVMGALFQLGAFAPVRVEERAMGPHRFVYRTLQGANPRDVGAITNAVDGALRAAGAKRIQPLGFYFPEGSGRPSEIGCAVADADAAALAKLDASFLQRTLPAADAMVARFPWKHALSYALGYLKVSPMLRAHRMAHGYQDGPSYTLHEGNEIVYVQPVVEQPR